LVPGVGGGGGGGCGELLETWSWGDIGVQ